MNHIKITRIEVHAIPTATLDSCIKESIEFALKEGQDVKLIYNTQIYSIVIKDLFHFIKNESKQR